VSPEPRALVITGDGLNCERETAQALRLAGAAPELVHVSDAAERGLEDFQILVLIGGFANGDHLGAGTVQASLFRHRLRRPLERFVASGRLVLGVCNGFQTLVKMGLLPEAGWERTATIMPNDSGRFEDRWVHLAAVRDAAATLSLRRRAQVALRYADSRGRPTMDYPANPNGSEDAVAGVCDPSGRIFGLMPHPEAYLSPYNHPSWTRRSALGQPLPQEGEGVSLFRNAVAFARAEGLGP
jgi:phosphoribosylformylglycinamidine (FGAM) synthase-like amidotransferase family enzyme